MKKVFKLIVASIFLISCGKRPVADFSWSPQNPKAGQEVQFTNQSTDAKKYDWNLGNMSISSETNPKTVYTNAGDYSIDLTARNGTKSKTKTLTIKVSP